MLGARLSHSLRLLPVGSGPSMIPADVDLEPAISSIAEPAKVLTGASGAAIALRKGDEMGPAGHAPGAPRLT